MDISKLTIEETLTQCSKPTGNIGIEFGKRMNEHHKPLLTWGLAFLFNHKKRENLKILDVGCGAGLAINLMSKAVPGSKITGIDYSDEMVKYAKKINRNLVESGSVIIQKGSVENLPFEDNQFDFITATETIYFWPNLLENIKEVYRTLANNGTFAIINEDYCKKDSSSKPHSKAMLDSDTTNLLEEKKHIELLENAGFRDIKVNTIPSKGWIMVYGRKNL
jgi:ubiquinone/menaquinone biosynthesis C-methylase UbiE